MAYENRISDLTSDVCSSDLLALNAVLSELGPRFAAGAAAHDADDSFVTENYRALRTAKVFSAQVPTDLGGSGAGHGEICAFLRSEEHTSELQSLMRISYAVFCLKKKKK